MINAINKEIEDFIVENKVINSIYFGGGTPGILSMQELESIFNIIYKKFEVENDTEITLEVNPDDVNPASVRGWKSLGVNRLSMGIQSFDDAELKWMNRAHTAAESIACLDIIKRAGFVNFSADLIYGSPMQTREMLQDNIKILAQHGVPHISAYALTVEPKTVLEKQILKGKISAPDEMVQHEMYELLTEALAQNGYEQYEISSFCLPDRQSRHNSSYWQGKPYYGFGPSAHSFNGAYIRSWNIANNALYISNIENGLPISEAEYLTVTQKRNEQVMLGLRLKKGIDLNKFEMQFGQEEKYGLIKSSEKYIQSRHCELEQNFLRLTKAGSFLADGIASDLFKP